MPGLEEVIKPVEASLTDECDSLGGFNKECFDDRGIREVEF